jgi:hypothetical protein
LENVSIYKIKVGGDRMKIQRRESKGWQPLKLVKVREEESKGICMPVKFF